MGDETENRSCNSLKDFHASDSAAGRRYHELPIKCSEKFLH